MGGFNQAYRSLISESVAGPATAPEFETLGAGFDHKFERGTCLSVEGEILSSAVDRDVGIFRDAVPSPQPSSTRQELDYKEKNFSSLFRGE